MGTQRQAFQGKRLVERRSQRRRQIGGLVPATDRPLPQPRENLSGAIGGLPARVEPRGERLARRLRGKAQEIDGHLKPASTPTRYAEPTSFTPASRASVTRYFPIVNPSPATGRQPAPLE